MRSLPDPGRLLALLPLLAGPLLMAAASADSDMYAKLIEIHGTYLEDGQPMPCGAGTLDPGEELRISEWFEKVAGWPNFREAYPKATWATDPAACRVPMSSTECLSTLKVMGVPHEVVPPPDAPGVHTPVRITGAVNGVSYVHGQPLIVDCELAASLPRVSSILREWDVTEVGILSAHRPEAIYSFHMFGLALDVNWIKSDRWLRAMWVKTDFVETPEVATCDATGLMGIARDLVGIACDLWEARAMNTVITPNYNKGHDNHYHLDIRPGDNRFFIN